MARELRSVRSRHDDPDLPDDVEPRDLDKGARIELKTLSKENSDWVARHLVMAARLIEDDPEQAHQHAMSAARRAGRIGVVRETLAITAYATGDFALALRELRTYRRISGSNEQLPLMVDSERGVGRADRALELGRSVDRSTLPNDVQVSLAIAMSGARLDLGQSAAALAELEIPQLDPNRAFSWSPDLFHAYADVLDELGRTEQAETWRERAARADEAIGTATSLDEHETVDIVEEEFEVFDVDGEDSVSFGDAGTVDDGEDVVIEIEDDDLLDDETADGEFLDEQFGGDELTEDELADDEVASVELENEQLAEETLADEKPESDQPEGGELGRVENASDDEEDGSNDGTVPTDR
jgi:tetratricopeptide (TPR) repeat protein